MKIEWGFWFSHFAPTFGLALFIAGALIMCIRLTINPNALMYAVYGGSAALLCSIVYACIRIIRKIPSRDNLVIWLDAVSNGGGIPAASRELSVGLWLDKINIQETSFRLNFSRKGIIVLVCGIAFFAGTILFPLTETVFNVKRDLDITQELADLERKLDILSEESLISENTANEIRNNLEDLEQNNDAEKAGEIYERIEALNRKLDATGEDAANNIENKMQSLDALSAMADALGNAEENPELMKARQELAELMKQLAEDDPELAELMKEVAQNANQKDFNPDAETLKQLANALRNNKEELKERLEKLKQANLNKKKCDNPSECDGGECNGSGNGNGEFSEEDLEEWLQQNAEGAENLCETAIGLCELPGRGGISRGRGDADLNFIGNTEGEADNVKEIDVASPASDPENSELLAVKYVAPQTDDTKEAAAGNLNTTKGTLERRDRAVFPAHRRAVEKYFEKK